MPEGGGSVQLEGNLHFVPGVGGDVQYVSDTLFTGTGSAGQDLYVDIRADRSLFPEDIVWVIDDFWLTTDGPADMLDVLYRVRDVTTDLSATPRFWAVFLEGDEIVTGLDFAATTLHAGDSVLLALTQDRDGDGLYAAQEQQYGSSDATIDTDGDGVSDPIEAARRYIDHTGCGVLDGGWPVKIIPASGAPIEFRAYSDPARADSDGDGLTDYEEWRGADGFAPDHPSDTDDATNPLSRDTDGDGLFDAEDPFPTIEAITLYVDITASGSNNGLSWDNAYTSLATAMTNAETRNTTGGGADDVSEIWVAAGTYTLTDQLLPRSTKIYGGFAGNESRVGQRNPVGLTNGTFIAQGTSGNPMVKTNSSPQIDVRLDGFMLQDAVDESAIKLQGGESNVEIANCFFFNNTHDVAGPAINATNTILTIEDCIFSDNQLVGGTGATQLNGGAVAVTGSSSQLAIRRCSFVRNSASPGDTAVTVVLGGALYVWQASTVTIEDSRFLNNTILERDEAAGDSDALIGGAVVLSLVSSATIRNTTFEGNEVDFNENVLISPSWPNGVIWEGDRRSGGAVAVFGSPVGGGTNFVNCLFKGNRASMFGGGLVVGDAKAKVVNCTFFGNEVYPDLKSSDTIKEDRFCDSAGPTTVNTRPIAVGGGIGAASGSQVIVDNTVFWGNTGTDFVVMRGDFAVLDTFLDIEQQFSTQPGPLADAPISCLDAGGSITYNNCAIQIVSLTFTDHFGAQTSDGGADFAGMTEGSGNITPTSPGFESATGGDLRLSTTSVLIDAGNKLIDADVVVPGFQLLPLFDLDGNNRVIDGDGDGTEEIDIGAYENQGS